MLCVLENTSKYEASWLYMKWGWKYYLYVHYYPPNSYEFLAHSRWSKNKCQNAESLFDIIRYAPEKINWNSSIIYN